MKGEMGKPVNIPDRLFGKRKTLFGKDKYMCPICNKKMDLDKERYDKTKSIPYIRVHNKMFYCHKDCYFLLYDCLKATIMENKEEYMVYEI